MLFAPPILPRLACNLPKLMTCASSSNHLDMITWAAPRQKILFYYGRLTLRTSHLRSISSSLARIRVPPLQLDQASVSRIFTPQLRRKVRCSWAAPLRPSLLPEATSRAVDIQVSHRFMDSPQTTFFVRPSVPFALRDWPQHKIRVQCCSRQRLFRCRQFSFIPRPYVHVPGRSVAMLLN